jgi:hypothetical protein
MCCATLKLWTGGFASCSMQMNILSAFIGSLVFISTLVTQGYSAQKAEADSPASPRVYMSYFIAERQTTELEEHQILIQFGIDAGRRLTYDYSDWVIGAKAKQAVSTRFHAPHGITISDEEVRALIAHLEDIHIYDFRSDSEPEGETPYEESLELQVDAQDFRLTFYHPSQNSGRLAMKKILLDLAEKLGIDKPSSGVNARITSEGDLEPSRAVSLERLRVEHDQYQGKRISVVGFFDGRSPESRELFVNQRAALNRDIESSVWLGEVPSVVHPPTIKGKAQSWMRIEGVFLWGRYGHKGNVMGMIDRITKIELLEKPEQ